MKYIPTIGLEVHVQLDTQSKMFCACSTRFGEPPNTNVCPVCLGYPGSLPVMNADAIKRTVITGMMIGSEISAYSKFDRKSYFYPDMPKNYQISQYDMPLCLGGSVETAATDAKQAVRVKRIHLEEDVGKSMHLAGMSSVDFNRAGVPLMEIVTEPDIASPEEAYAFLSTLRQILLYAGVSRCNLEEGNMRCDVNCSVRPEGTDKLGTKIEIKNMNTFKGVLNALHHEIDRQTSILASGGTIRQETRRWDADLNATFEMRSKEDAHDYRYFPDPDLMPVVIPAATLAEWRGSLPELPAARRARMESQYSIPAYDAGVLAADKAVADFFEAAAALTRNFKAVSNWMMTDVLRLLSEKEMELSGARLTPNALASLIDLVDRRVINMPTAREIFVTLFESGGDPAAIVAQKGLAQVSDSGEIEKMVDAAIEANPKSVADYRNGKTAAAKFLVGQVMKISKGKADPQAVAAIIERRLREAGQ